MPHANVWIRKKNEQRWNELGDKSDWVNRMLEEGVVLVPGDAKKITKEMYSSPTTRTPPRARSESHQNFFIPKKMK